MMEGSSRLLDLFGHRREETGCHGTPDRENEMSQASSNNPMIHQSNTEFDTGSEDTPSLMIIASSPHHGLSSLNQGEWRLLPLIGSNFGVLLALVSTTCFAIQGVLFTLIADDIDPFQLNVLLMPVLIGGSTCLMVINAIAPPKTLRQYLWLLLSGLSLSGQNPFLVSAYRHILYTDVLSIGQLSIILVGILNWVIVREPFRLSHFLLALLALVGVFCISRPTVIFGNDGEGQLEGANRLLGTAFAFGAACCTALTIVIVRKQSTIGIHPFQSIVSNAFVVGAVNGILCATVGEWRCLSVEVLLMTFGDGLVYLIAQTTLYSALAREPATKVSNLSTLIVVISFVLQLVIFKVVPPWTSWVGSLIIMAACIGTLLVKRPISRMD